MGINLGNNSLSKLYLGSNEVQKVYQGNVEIFPLAPALAPYIIEVDTSLPGVSNSDQFILFTQGSGFDFEIKWGDGVTETYSGSPGSITHTYPAPGVYDIEITGDFPHVIMYYGGDEQKLTKIKQWGDIQWGSFSESYTNCSSLEIVATDAPNLTNVTDFNFSFLNCSNPNFSTAHNFNAWDMSGVTGMLAMFLNTQFNQPIGSWNTGAVTITNAMFGSTPFNQDISGWDMSSNTDAQTMFNNATAFNQDISGWNTSNMFNMIGMFQDATAFNQDISGWDTSNVGVMSHMFQGATAFNQDLSTWNITFLNEAFGQPLIQTFQNSGMSTENYSRTLIGWANTVFANGNQPINIDMTMQDGMQYNDIEYTTGNQFNDAVSARDYLVNTCGWVIDGDVNVLPFIIEVDTSITGAGTTTPAGTFRLPTGGSGHNFTVDWGDGVTETYSGSPGDIDHVYPSAGIYEIKIHGSFPHIRFVNAGDRARLTKIKQWGDVVINNMQFAYTGCNNLRIIAADSPIFSTSNKIVQSAFQGCSHPDFATDHDFNVWDTSTFTNTNQMFRGSSFNKPIGNWDVSKVTNMAAMFLGTPFNQPIGSWNTAALTNPSEMFAFTPFNQPIGSWDMSKVTTLFGMFEGATAFNQPLNTWNTAAVTSMNKTFRNASAFNQNIGGWNTAAVTNMADTFQGATAFNQNIGGWNTGAVTNMAGMFVGATAFNQNIGGWNTAAVTNMGLMFNNASAFNQNIGGWNTGNVTNMDRMFNFAISFNNGGNTSINNWDVRKVTNMNRLFQRADSFNQPLQNWRTDDVTNMTSMFAGAGVFNQPINTVFSGGATRWDTSKVTDMNAMFSNATAFNQNIGNWNTLAVTNMSLMFDNAVSFNNGTSTSIGNWLTNNVTGMDRMFRNATVFNRNISGWCVVQIPTEPTDFSTGSALTAPNKPNWGAPC